jgi:hypothetical protein
VKLFAISNPKVKQDRFFLCIVHAARIFVGVYRRRVSGYTTHSGDKEEDMSSWRAHHEHYGSGRLQLVT